MIVQYRVISPETIFIETTKADSALCFIYVCLHIYVTIMNNTRDYLLKSEGTGGV